MKLLIYLPVFNGATRIEKTLISLFNAIDNLPEDKQNSVIVHINDNHSSDNTIKICNKFIRNNVFIESNFKNVGFVNNLSIGFLKDYDQDFTWIIGDDDILLPNALVRIYDFENRLKLDGINIDLFHVNAGLIKDEIFSHENFLNLLNEGKCSAWYIFSQKFKQPTICKFSDLIDPKIESSTLAGIMTVIFNSKKVREAVTAIDFNAEIDLLQGHMNAKRAFPHVYAFIQTFNENTVCFSDPNLYIVTSYGHQTWKSARNRIFSIGALDSLIKMHDKKIISYEHLLYALNGLVMNQKSEFKHIIFSQEFEDITVRYKDILLKALFYDSPKK
jgi:hypothetical protein